ncbi:E3 ubiquitin-protein ligase RNF19A-like [Scaptodrosophila lebanonensis]|uniref:RBR-type E3 ubiquitin transferase n=1 Tax=Drosophila lebanonensis TaxID=7225 RepID=A0A6J2TYH4_DROLE|nr:E3 ubiquitin-protein ligase RNF19A-like [Scaptodrosophila lebanonensis]
MRGEMSKCTESVDSFSVRAIILRTCRLTEGGRTKKKDVECGSVKAENIQLETNDAPFTTTIKLPNDQCLTGGSNKNELLCNICFINECSEIAFFQLVICGHKFCVECLIKYIGHEITCPQCSCEIHPNDIELILHDLIDIKSKYQDFMIRRYLVSDPDSRWCPAPDCNFAVIATGCASCPEIQCGRPTCGMSFCYHCKDIWHPDQTCDAARSSRQAFFNRSSINFIQDSGGTDEIKPCPRCRVLIVKMNDGSCNHMACSLCGAEFCWLCMKEVSDLHYLSPSGCTFWGKKPWSRKKKVIWQLGTLIGAPIGIALLAGIAVPSILIGIPVWVGRKLLTRYKAASKRKRNISVGVGVAASILLAPILAGLAIAVGVPILLFYVYGIVPVSLIRAGCANVSDGDHIVDDNSSTYRTKYKVESTCAERTSKNGDTITEDKGLTTNSKDSHKNQKAHTATTQ